MHLEGKKGRPKTLQLRLKNRTHKTFRLAPAIVFRRKTQGLFPRKVINPAKLIPEKAGSRGGNLNVYFIFSIPFKNNYLWFSPPKNVKSPLFSFQLL